MNPRKYHIWVSCILSVALLLIGGYLAKDATDSFFNLGNLFGPGLFVVMVFPVYCVAFYWLTYPFFRISSVSLAAQRKYLPKDSSWQSVVFSLIGFLMPPFSMIGTIVGHRTLIWLRVANSPKKGRLALAGIILGHLTLGFWPVVLLVGYFLWGPGHS